MDYNECIGKKLHQTSKVKQLPDGSFREIQCSYFIGIIAGIAACISNGNLYFVIKTFPAKSENSAYLPHLSYYLCSQLIGNEEIDTTQDCYFTTKNE